jgi:cytochrome P450
VPAVLTLAMLGIPLKNWAIYSEPVHASVYTPEHSPDIDKIVAMHRQMGLDLLTNMVEIKENPRPGIVNGLIQLRIDGEPAPDLEVMGNLGLVIGGGFDTTTALTAHSMEWLSQHPDQRERLSRERDALLHAGARRWADVLRRRGNRRHAVQRGRAALDFLGDGQPRSVGVPRA